jgi:adenylosuccinate lyase
VAEAYQTILRRNNYEQPYEALKAATRGVDHIDKSTMQNFIESLTCDESVKEQMRQITPASYNGIFVMDDEL